jgi:hypothetical protein
MFLKIACQLLSADPSKIKGIPQNLGSTVPSDIHVCKTFST